MTDHQHHHDSDQSLPSELVTGLTDAARLRAIADGEINADVQNDSDRARVDFERELRARVARVMSNVELPGELRSRIEMMIAQRETPEVIRPAYGDTRSPSFWQRHSAILSAAAVLALCVGLISLSFNRSQTGTGQNLAGITLPIAQIASFAHRQHEACDPTVEATMTKFQARTHEDAIAYTGDQLGAVPPLVRDRLMALDSIGFRFGGVGGCRVPGEGPSVHAIYFREDNASTGCAKISLFIQTEPAQKCGIDRTMCLLARCAETKKQTLAVWHQDGFIYYLYSPDEATRNAAQQALGAPAAIFEYSPS